MDVYCVDGAYHGNSAATLAISPYNKYAPVEAPADVVKLMSPDKYKLGLSEAETTMQEGTDWLSTRSGSLAPAAPTHGRLPRSLSSR